MASNVEYRLRHHNVWDAARSTTEVLIADAADAISQAEADNAAKDKVIAERDATIAELRERFARVRIFAHDIMEVGGVSARRAVRAVKRG